MKLQLIDSGKASALTNMAIDQKLLEGLLLNPEPILHFYEWETNSGTYGHFIRPFAFLNEQAVQKHQLQLAKRPTGGGIVFHLCDFAFSMLVPATHWAFSLNTLENYAFVNRLVANSIQCFLGISTATHLLPIENAPLDQSSGYFCMAKPTIYDVMLDGRKVGGGAQRRTKQGFLHQGTISLAMPSEEFLNEILLPGTSVLEEMRRNTFALLGQSYSLQQITEAKKQFRQLLYAQACDL